MLAVEDIQDALDRPVGKRALNPSLRVVLDDVNQGEFVHLRNSNYLHWSKGGYALVYHIRTRTGHDIALRCLTIAADADAAERCNALDDFLTALVTPLPYFVRQRFYPDALFAGGSYQPIFIMDWVAGDTVGVYAQKLIATRNISGFKMLADKLTRMIKEMQSANIAHGDIQHENIMVLPTGDLSLVDYDSMYVPALHGLSCPVGGMDGYGHPAYVSNSLLRPYNSNMDTFAGLVLIVSLRAIAADPSIFQRHTSQNLVFRGDDLREPTRSPVFSELLAMGDAFVSSAARALYEMCLDPAKAEVPIVQVPGFLATRKKAPGPRLVEPTLPVKPSPWTRRLAVADSVFDGLFKIGAS